MRMQSEVAERAVEKFNNKFVVGDDIIVIKDDRRHVHTKIRHPATVMGGHSAMGWAEDISGAYLLERFVDPLSFQCSCALGNPPIELPLSIRRVGPGEYTLLTASGLQVGRIEGTAFAVWLCATANSTSVAERDAEITTAP